MNRTYSEQEITEVAEGVLGHVMIAENGATVVGLSGDLGAGKTTLVQALARILGVHEVVTSPTFVIAKFYETTDTRWRQLVHVDAYKIETLNELEPLGWSAIIASPQTLVVVEWPERIAPLLPETTQYFMIEHDIDRRRIFVA